MGWGTAWQLLPLLGAKLGFLIKKNGWPWSGWEALCFGAVAEQGDCVQGQSHVLSDGFNDGKCHLNK